MLILVTGGSGSGKSEYAEGCCMALQTGKKTYIATMEPYGEEGAKRIARHHKLREGKGFETLECYTHLEDVLLPEDEVVLLECMSNLVANEIFSDAGRKELVTEVVLEGIRKLNEQVAHLILVTNQVFSDGIKYDPMTELYLEKLGEVNAGAAAMADRVVEVVCGIPVEIKGQ